MTDHDRTHWDDCWRVHPDCAYERGLADALRDPVRAAETATEPRSDPAEGDTTGGTGPATHSGSQRSILDEAEQDLLVDAFDEVVEEARRHVAAVVLRVAADRLRAKADEAKSDSAPAFLAADLYWAADLLTEGTDR